MTAATRTLTQRIHDDLISDGKMKSTIRPDRARLVSNRTDSDVRREAVPRPWQGDLAKKPWEYCVTAVIPHRNTLEHLKLCLDFVQAQTERPYVMIIDTGSDEATLAGVLALRSDNVEVHLIACQGTEEYADVVCYAMDLAMSACRTEYLWCLHSDCFVTNRSLLAEMLSTAAGGKQPVIGYESTSANKHPECKGMVSHTCTLLHMPTMHELDVAWSRTRLATQSTSAGRDVVFDPEMALNYRLRDRGIAPLILGPEQASGIERDGNRVHLRSATLREQAVANSFNSRAAYVSIMADLRQLVGGKQQDSPRHADCVGQRDDAEPLKAVGGLQSARLRVGIVSNGLLLGGAEMWVASLVRNLDQSRIDVSGVVQMSDEFSYSQLLHRVSSVAPLYLGKAGIEKLAAESDVLICWGVRQLGSLLPDSFKGKVILVAHGRNEWDAGIIKEASGRATHFAAVSAWAADTYSDTGHTERPVTVIHNGVDVDRCKPIIAREETRAAWGLNAGDIAIGYLGGIKKAFKNSLAVAKAAAYLGEPYRAVYVGSDYDNLGGEIRRISPNAVIRQPDFQAGNALSAFDCLMLASDTEGFSLALTEAWLAGVPTVATPVGAVPELEQVHGQLTVHAPVGASPEELAAAVTKALSPENRRVVEHAKRVTELSYTAAAMGRRWSEYLCSLDEDSKPVADIAATPHPSVSVVVAARNYGHFLRDCLESCLRQSIKPVDVIYSDDFSTDDSLKIARTFPGVTVLEAERHHGVCVARNRGVRASKGDVLIHVDGDDTLPPNYIEKHLAVLTNTTPFSYGPFQSCGLRHDIFNVPEWDSAGLSRLLHGNFVHTSAAVWRWAFDAVGGWQETSANTAWDWYMALRLSTLGTPTKSGATLQYRKHPGSYSQTKGEQSPCVALPTLLEKIREDFRAFRRQPSVSAICAVSKPVLAPLSLECWRMASPGYREILFGYAPGLPDDLWNILHGIPRSQFHEGTAHRDDAGEVRFRLLDNATGDWIANIDDDDIWVHVPDLSTVPDDVGIISGAGLYFELHRPLSDPTHVVKHDPEPIAKPCHACKMRSSHWLVRRKAWEQVSAQIDRIFWYSDWRLAYRIIEAGWKALVIPRLLGIMRRYTFDYPSGSEWSWDKYVKTLEVRS